MKNEDIKIEVKVDEEIASGIFSNFTNISHSPEEILLDFLFIHPTPPPGFGKLRTRVIITPAHAKRLLNALGENLREYEERFGEIKISNQINEVKNIQ